MDGWVISIFPSMLHSMMNISIWIACKCFFFPLRGFGGFVEQLLINCEIKCEYWLGALLILYGCLGRKLGRKLAEICNPQWLLECHNSARKQSCDIKDSYFDTRTCVFSQEVFQYVRNGSTVHRFLHFSRFWAYSWLTATKRNIQMFYISGTSYSLQIIIFGFDLWDLG